MDTDKTTLEQIKLRVETSVPGAKLEIALNGSPSAQHSLVVDKEHALLAAHFLKEDPAYRFDYASNVTGVDWPETTIKETVKTKEIVDGVEREIERTTEKKKPGFLETVYHLYSMAKKHGPIIAGAGICNFILLLTPITRILRIPLHSG